MFKRGLVLVLAVILLSGLVGAGFFTFVHDSVFTGHWYDYLTGNIVQEEDFITYVSPDGSSPVNSNPLYIEAGTSKKAKCYYHFNLKGNTGFLFFELFNLTKGTYHYTSVELNDNDYEMSIKCTDEGGNTNMEKYLIKIKTEGRWVYRPEPSSLREQEEEEIVVGEVSEEEPAMICDGCVFDNVCLKEGNTINAYYCDGENLKPRFDDEVRCFNNYECLSNVCMNNICGKEKSLLVRFLEYLKGFIKQ